MASKSESQQTKKELETELNELTTHLEARRKEIQRLEMHDEKGKLVKNQLQSVQRVASAL